MRILLRRALPALALVSMIVCTPAFAGMVESSSPAPARAEELAGDRLAQGTDLAALQQALAAQEDLLPQAGTHGWIIAASIAVIVAMIIVIVVLVD